MQKNAPDFIGIGAGHAGLGIITSLLAAHPAVASGIPSTNFFDTTDCTTETCAVYETSLPNRGKKGLKVGEVSAGYLVSPAAAERIASAYPTSKLFVIIRNPLDRAAAIYEQAKRAGRVPHNTSCARYLADHPSLQTGGFYGHHLHSYFIYYTSLQLHVIVYEDFAREPLKTMEELYTFLEIDPHFIPKALAAYAPPPDEPKHRGRISRLIHFVIKLIKKARSKPFVPIVPPPYVLSKFFSDEELGAFKTAYAADADHLSNLLHRNMGVFWELDPVPVGSEESLR